MARTGSRRLITGSQPPATASRRLATPRQPLTYRAAGVDRAVKDGILAGVRERIRATFQTRALGSGEEFGGLFHLNGYRDPVLVSSIDGVGTKARLAALCGLLQVAGADAVSHGANDVLCQGARPLFMLDYVAASSLDPGAVTEVIAGIADACRIQGITLLGGEIAEMPGVYARGELDIVGCTVGVVERDQVITGAAIRPHDVIVGLASDGLHTNGFSLARAALLPATGGPAAARRALGRRPIGFKETLGELLLRPHRPYARAVLALSDRARIRGIAHVTGGGIPGNLIRILPEGCRAVLTRSRWPVPPVFSLIRTRGRIAEDEMFGTFNMGLGLLLVVPLALAEAAVAHLDRAGEHAWIVGQIVAGPRGVEIH